MARITTIFWDCGDVLFPDIGLYDPEFKSVRHLLGINTTKAKEVFDKFWYPSYRLGKMNEDDYWREFIKASKNRPRVERIKMLFRKCLVPHAKVFNLIKKLAKDYEQYLLTNHSLEWVDYLTKKYRLDKYFKRIFNSADLEAAKPDKKFYEIVLKKAKKHPLEVVYIDDVKENLKVAASFGIGGILYKDTEKVEDLQIRLTEYLIIKP